MNAFYIKPFVIEGVPAPLKQYLNAYVFCQATNSSLKLFNCLINEII